MKKRYFTILSASILMILAGCSDWLDVTPRSEIREDVLISTEDGYKKALIGAYILTAQRQLYGRNTSMYFPEALSRHWMLPATNTTELYRLSNFEYTTSNVESLISDIWINYYKVIVQLNNILTNVETPIISFNYDNDKLIQGEALGLRAFLHLDILRYFGPVPDNTDGAAIAIPYMTEMTKDANRLISISYSEVVKHIEQDLNEAERLLENIDPILFNSNNQLNSTTATGEYRPEDSWQLYRQSRFNYYAVLGTKARFYHWIGDKAQAVAYAKQVIEAVNSDDTPKFSLATEATYSVASGSGSNLVMFSEHLFGIHNPDLQSIIESSFKTSSATLTQTEANLKIAYENTVHVNDIRYRVPRYWEMKTYQNGATMNHFKKYTGTDQIPTNNRVPLLRLAEMYLILIEDLPVSEAEPYFITYRIARALDASIDNSSTADEAAVLSRLEKEYRKEFYGEGQMFFFYKKHNYTRYTWPTTFVLPADAYVIPKPKGQISFE